MKNILKLFSLFVLISFSYGCQQESAGEDKLNYSTELRAAGCVCDDSDIESELGPVVINVEDGCEMENGQCCFDLRILSSYVVPSSWTGPIPANILCPEFGFSQSFTEDPVTGLYHFCISCSSTFFRIKIYNYNSVPNRYDCFQYDSPCN